MGHFIMVIDPAKFVGAPLFALAMQTYLASLRTAQARPDGRVMAPGDREWEEADRRDREGIPIDPDTARFLKF
jgi:LDH2 family malate/lactate/ureidoglycolate dehydrogenase